VGDFSHHKAHKEKRKVVKLGCAKKLRCILILKKLLIVLPPTGVAK